MTTCAADLNTRSELRLCWCAILGWNQSPSVASGAFADGADDLELRAFGEAPRMLAWPRNSSASAPALTAQRHRIGHQDAPELMSRRGGCTCCLLCCERICERNAAQLPRWGEMRRDGWDGRLIVTCAFETREATGDGDRLAHNPEVTCTKYACPWTEEFRERRSTARWRVDARRRPHRQLVRLCTGHVRKARLQGPRAAVSAPGRL